MTWMGEVGMEIFSGPAVPFAVLVAVALFAWRLGHRHAQSVVGMQRQEPAGDAASGLPALPLVSAGDRAGHAVADHLSGSSAHAGRDTADRDNDAPLCQRGARDERKVALEAAISLGDVHEEMIAYRRQEQVLFGAQGDAMAIALTPASERLYHRYTGLSGQPTCPPPRAALTAGVCKVPCHCDGEDAPGSPGTPDDADARRVTMPQPASASERV